MIEQLAIALFGLVTVALIAIGRSPFLFYGCLVGLLGQPFWLSVTYREEQWGMFTVSTIYAITYALGVLLHYPQGTRK